MPRINKSIKLSEQEELELRGMLSKGEHSSRKLKRIQGLLKNHEGLGPRAIANTGLCSEPTVYNILRRYKAEGLESAIHEKPRCCDHLKKVNQKIEGEITTIACSEPPSGRSRWTLRMITDKYIEMSNEESLSRETVRSILKKAT